MSSLLFKHSCVFFVFALFAVSSGITVAAESVAMPVPFPQSELVSTTEIDSQGHLVLFSPVREVNNEIRSETMARLPVSGESRLYEVARDSNRARAKDFYISELQAAGAKILYECIGVNCGRSNVWANQVFGQRVLYGRDTNQDYLVAETKTDDGSRWLTVIYTVTRGNLREYVWVEHLKVKPGVTIPGIANASSRMLGPVIVPWQGSITYRFDWTATDRRKISDWAASEGSVVVLAGFSSFDADETLEQAMVRAEKATRSLADVLAKTGVAKEQQQLIVIGPTVLFSEPERQGNRVEITVVKR